MSNVDGGLAGAGGPYASSVDGGNAAGNTYTPPAWRWTLSDTVTGELYTFENNPTTASPLPLQKNVTPYAVSADDGYSVFYEGADAPQVASFQVTVLTQSFYTSLVYWYSKRRQVLLTDDLGNAIWIYFTQFTPTRKWTVQHPWRHDITMNFYVFGQQAVTAQ